MAAKNAVIGALRVVLGIDSAQFSSGIKKSKSDLDKFAAAVEKRLLAVAAVAATAAGAIALGVGNIVKRADRLGEVADMLGLNVERLQELRHAAEMTGMASDNLDVAMRRFIRRSAEAAQGTGAAKNAFRELGITLKDTNGKLKPAEELLGEVADQFEKVPDHANKLRLAFQMFDTDGAAMVNVLAGGSAKLNEFAREAQELGIVIDRDVVLAAGRFNDNLDLIGKTTDGLWVRLTAKMMPSLEAVSKLFLDFARDESDVSGALENIDKWFRAIVEDMALATQYARNFIAEIKALWSVAGSLGDAAALAFQAKNIKSVEQFEAYREAHRKNLADLVKHWEDFRGIEEEGAQKIIELRKKLAEGWANAGLGGGGGGDGGGDKPPPPGGDLPEFETDAAKREREIMEARFERLQEMFMTEEELEAAHYAKRLEELQKFQEARVASDEEVAELRAKIEQDYADKVARIQEERLNSFASTLGSAGSIIESLTKIMGKEGDKQLGIVKALSLAEALINVYTGITAALRLPFPANMAAAAAVAAKGFSVIASMRSTSKGSSSGSAGASGGGGASAATGGGGAQESSGPSRELIVSGIRPDQLYTGDVLRNLMDALVEKQNDGYKLVTLAA